MAMISNTTTLPSKGKPGGGTSGGGGVGPANTFVLMNTNTKTLKIFFIKTSYGVKIKKISR